MSLLSRALEPVEEPAGVARALRGFSAGRKSDADAAAALSKRAFTVSPLLPRVANLLVYLFSYRAFQNLYTLTRARSFMPWQTAVNVDVERSYTAIARAKAAQDATGLVAVGGLLCAILIAAVKAARVALCAIGA